MNLIIQKVIFLAQNVTTCVKFALFRSMYSETLPPYSEIRDCFMENGMAASSLRPSLSLLSLALQKGLNWAEVGAG